MFTPVTLICILLFLGIILVYAILFLRQQRKLSEFRAILLIRRKEVEQLKQRKSIIIMELSRIKPEYKKNLWNLKLLRIEQGELRDDIRIDIDNIRKDSNGFPDGTAGSLGRVVARRKEILKEKLEDYNNRRVICLDRQQVVVAADNAVKSLSVEKDENGRRFEYFVSQVKQMELELSEISNAPVLKLPAKWRSKKNQTH